jgi:hypothetical protein
MRRDPCEVFQELLFETRRGPSPSCPIGRPVVKSRKVYAVPVALRAVIACIVQERAQLNMRGDLQGNEYYRLSCSIESEYAKVIEALRKKAKLDVDSIIELHKGWTFTRTTLKRIQVGYETRKKKHAKRERRRKGGLSFAYLAQPPERCHLYQYHWLMSGVTLLDYLEHERKKHVPPQTTRSPP